MSASLNWIAWKSAIRLSELLALEGVRARGVERCLRDADRLCGDPDPPAVERRHRDGEALPLLVQEPVGVDVDVVEAEVRRRGRVEPELLLLARHLDVVGVEDERGDAAGAVRRRIRAREEQERRGVAAVRAPLLRAVDAPAVAVGQQPSSGAIRRPSPTPAR